MSSSLLQDVLRSTSTQNTNTDTQERRLSNVSLSSNCRNGGDGDDSEDELIGVVSMPGTPARSLPPSRPQSPIPRSTPATMTTTTTRPARALHVATITNSNTSTHGDTSRPPGQRKPSQQSSTDPLKALPSDLSQKIFTHLSIPDLAKCARVSQKWRKSQTLNYVWFQHYRKENFQDESLPPGKWTKRESKQNWRTTYLQSIPTRSRPPSGGPLNPPSSSSRPSSAPHSNLNSRSHTPSLSVREANEEKWRLEAEAITKPGKGEMREMYKEMGGRKARGKGVLGGGGVRDRGGYGVEW